MMVALIESCSLIRSAGNIPKTIEEEYVGRFNSNTVEVSIARMKSPGGWEEPGQTLQFDQYHGSAKGTVASRDKGRNA